MSEESQFLQQMSGSSAANLIFVIAFAVYRIFSTKCKHSKCKSRTKLCECETQEDSISTDKEHDEIVQVRREFEEKMQNVFSSLNRRLYTSRKTLMEARREYGLETTPRKHILAEKQDAEGQVWKTSF